MGVRGELFTTKVALQNRTYFFNVKENRLGDLYLNIVESKNRDAGGFERQSVILFADDLQEFLTGFDESLRVLEKAIREKNKGEKPQARSKPRDNAGSRPPSRPRGDAPRGSRPKGDAGYRAKGDAGQRTRENRGNFNEKEGNRPPAPPRKRVVKRKD